MKLNFLKTACLLAITTIAVSTSTYAQQGEVTIIQHEKLPELLALNAKMSRENELADRYTIQLYYGNLKQANSIKSKYDRSFEKWESTIEYESPNYKVWIGNYRNRLEADRALLKIQEKFPSAFVFKPDR